MKVLRHCNLLWQRTEIFGDSFLNLRSPMTISPMPRHSKGDYRVHKGLPSLCTGTFSLLGVRRTPKSMLKGNMAKKSVCIVGSGNWYDLKIWLT